MTDDTADAEDPIDKLRRIREQERDDDDDDEDETVEDLIKDIGRQLGISFDESDLKIKDSAYRPQYVCGFRRAGLKKIRDTLRDHDISGGDNA